MRREKNILLVEDDQIDVMMVEKNILDIKNGEKEIFIESSVGSVMLNIIGVG